jgi:hypothetical protein
VEECFPFFFFFRVHGEDVRAKKGINNHVTYPKKGRKKKDVNCELSNKIVDASVCLIYIYLCECVCLGIDSNIKKEHDMGGRFRFKLKLDWMSLVDICIFINL